MNATHKWPSHQIEMALDAVSQAFAQVKAEPTPAEASLWTEEIDRLGPQPILAFMHFWVSGGGQSGFFRAPRIEDARRFVDPEWMDGEAALQRLYGLVAEVGSYRVPTAQQGMTARLAHAVAALGGWSRVCETLPDQSHEFAWREFGKKFDMAWNQAQGRSLLAHQPAPVLVALGQAQARSAMDSAAARVPQRFVADERANPSYANQRSA